MITIILTICLSFWLYFSLQLRLHSSLCALRFNKNHNQKSNVNVVKFIMLTYLKRFYINSFLWVIFLCCYFPALAIDNSSAPNIIITHSPTTSSVNQQKTVNPTLCQVQPGDQFEPGSISRNNVNCYFQWNSLQQQPSDLTSNHFLVIADLSGLKNEAQQQAKESLQQLISELFKATIETNVFLIQGNCLTPKAHFIDFSMANKTILTSLGENNQANQKVDFHTQQDIDGTDSNADLLLFYQFKHDHCRHLKAIKQSLRKRKLIHKPMLKDDNHIEHILLNLIQQNKINQQDLYQIKQYDAITPVLQNAIDTFEIMDLVNQF